MQRLHGNAPKVIALLVAGTTLLSLWGAANLLVRGALVVLLLALLGFVLTAAIFPSQRLGGVERTLYGLAASIALIALSGLALNFTPWGLDGPAWVLLLGAVTAGASLLAWRRRAPRPKPAAEPASRLKPLTLAQSSLFGLSAVMVVLALAVARVPAPPNDYLGYSLLSILPAPATTGAAAAGATAWQISVDSNEFTSTTYSLAVSLAGEVVYMSPNFTLAPHQQWQTAIDLAAYGRIDGELEARLYRSDAPGVVYRRVLVRDALRSGGS
jgi:hypothetical protein